MIKFFRKIRQNLLSEGKTGKYFKYAIGEIVLVVIGILIALGINDWNEKRKNREQGNMIKQVLKAELINDLELIKVDLKYTETELEINLGYAKRLSDVNANLDTLTNIVRNEYFIGFNTISELDKTTFKSLESTGTLNLIGNDLAKNTQKYYIGREFNIGVINNNNKIYYNLMEPFMLKYPANYFAINGHLREEYWESVDSNQLNGMFNGLLTSRLFNLRVRKRILKETIDKTQKLINQFD